MGESNWMSSAAYRFISDPQNRLTVRIAASIMLLFTLTLFFVAVGVMIYLAMISDSRGWVVLLLFLIPSLAGVVSGIVMLILVPKMRKNRRDYLARNPK